jgi:hypothetical protein
LTVTTLVPDGRGIGVNGGGNQGGSRSGIGRQNLPTNGAKDAGRATRHHRVDVAEVAVDGD